MHANPPASNGVNVVSELAAMDDRSWHKKPNLRALYMVLLPACVGADMTAAFDVNLMDVLQATSSWQISNMIGLIVAMYSLGAMFSLPFVPLIADGCGRRASIIFGCTVMFFGAMLQGASQNLAMFIAARFMLGFGSPFSIIGSTSLIGELSHPKERATMTSISLAFFGVGSILVAAISLGTCNMQSNWGWRIPSLLQATPSILQLPFVLFVPDSPRWLISKGRTVEGYEILVKYHGEGDPQSEFVKAEYAEIERTLGQTVTPTSWSILFSTPGMRKRAILAAFLGLGVQWSGGGLIGSYLPRILAGIGIYDNTTKNRINLAVSCWGLLCATTLALLATRFKRRTAFLTSGIALLLVMVGWTVATAEWTELHNRGSAVAVVGFIFLFSPAYCMGFSLVYTYLTELFPFHVRSKGIVLHGWFSRTGGFFNQIVNPIGLQNTGWKYYISYCVFLSFQVGFIYFMFPETSSRTLEELAFLYEDGNKTPEKSCGDKTLSLALKSGVSQVAC
ncbi:general substrate transporter [Mycena maculata]|uniref:General substrate transporter n=1 Tax=Mycena maculata TaxID=230809 RepID=A0AAD7I9B3_9AGAR|nr:general substrate transporter [Mycena maculata]